MRFNDIDLENGLYEGDDGSLLDALASVYAIHWDDEESSYVEIIAITRQKKPCSLCGEIGDTGVSVLTNIGEIQSCSVCDRISRISSLVFKETIIEQTTGEKE
jgi:hypothetical protein